MSLSANLGRLAERIFMDEEKNTNEEVADGAVDISGSDELSVARAEAASNLDGWRRAMADYANLKKDSEARAKEMSRYASADVVRVMLPVLETFGKAFAHMPADGADAATWKQWATGIGHVKSQFEKVLENAGVQPIDKTGVAFDPSMHEAMLQKVVEGTASGTVLTILEPGWKMHDRVLRPAKVEVAE